jgi:hypothetical protein
MKKPYFVAQDKCVNLQTKSCLRRCIVSAKRLFLCAISIVVLYVIFWGGVSSSLSYHLNSFFAGEKYNINWWDDKDYSITFSKASPHGFPFNIGVKLAQVVEESSDSVVTHQHIYAGYDLINQRLYITHNGTSIAKAKPLGSGFGSEIHGDYHYYAPCPFSARLLKILMNPDIRFELVNFIKSINFVAKDIKVYDLIDKSMTFDAKLMDFNLEVPERPYYHNMEEIRSNIPERYHLVSNILVTKSTGGRKIAPISFIYGAFPMNDFISNIDVEFTTQAKTFETIPILKNMEFKANKLRYADQAEDIDIQVTYKSASEADNLNISLDYSDSIQIKDDFMKHALEKVKIVSAELLQLDQASIMQSAIDSVLRNPEKYIPDFSRISKVQNKIIFDFTSKGNAFDINLKDFGTIVDGVTGYTAMGKLHVDDNFKWQASGQLLLSNYQNIVSFILDYMNGIQQVPRKEEVVLMFKESVSDLLRLISNHPESKASSIALDYEYNSDAGSGKIGRYDFSQILEIYYKSLYRNAIVIAQKSPNTFQKLRELLPDASPDLIDSLKNLSNESVIQPLAK